MLCDVLMIGDVDVWGRGFSCSVVDCSCNSRPTWSVLFCSRCFFFGGGRGVASASYAGGLLDCCTFNLRHTGPRSLPREKDINRAAGVLYNTWWCFCADTNDVGAADVDFVRCAALSAFSSTADVICLTTYKDKHHHCMYN